MMNIFDSDLSHKSSLFNIVNEKSESTSTQPSNNDFTIKEIKEIKHDVEHIDLTISKALSILKNEEFKIQSDDGMIN